MALAVLVTFVMCCTLIGIVVISVVEAYRFRKRMQEVWRLKKLKEVQYDDTSP